MRQGTLCTCQKILTHHFISLQNKKASVKKEALITFALPTNHSGDPKKILIPFLRPKPIHSVSLFPTLFVPQDYFSVAVLSTVYSSIKFDRAALFIFKADIECLILMKLNLIMNTEKIS